MSKPTDFSEFIRLLVASELADHEKIAPATHATADRFGSLTHPKALPCFCAELIADEVISERQCQKLLNGQWKWFFVGGYCILRHSHAETVSSFYNARNTATGADVLLEVWPDDARRLQFRVVDTPG